MKLCLKIVRQVAFLNCHGFFISDYNVRNFALCEEQPDHVLMFDSDSFGYGNFFGNIFAGNSTLSRNYDARYKQDALTACDDALYVFIFSRLSVGDAPIFLNQYTQARTFRYDKQNDKEFRRKYLFPERVWDVFESAFHGETAFSVPILLWALSESLKYLEQHPFEDFIYGEKMDGLKIGVTADPHENASKKRSRSRNQKPRKRKLWWKFKSGKYNWVLFAIAAASTVGLAAILLFSGG